MLSISNKKLTLSTMEVMCDVLAKTESEKWDGNEFGVGKALIPAYFFKLKVT